MLHYQCFISYFKLQDSEMILLWKILNYGKQQIKYVAVD